MLCWGKSTAYSQSHAAAELKSGERAPFDGVLLKKEDLATIITDFEKKLASVNAELEILKKQNQMTAEFEKEKCAIQVRAEKSETTVCESARIKEAGIYENALKKTEPSSFWKSQTFAGILGLGAGAAICAAAR